MRLHTMSALMLLTASSLFACSGAAPADPSAGSAQDLSTVSSVPSPTSATGVHRDPICPEDEKVCIERKSDGLCGPVCVPKPIACTDVCVAPPSAASGEGGASAANAGYKPTAKGEGPSSSVENPIICDPDGPAPHAGCSWNEKTCEWDCPVCDPVGTPPREGCTWSETNCDWQCPVCDPTAPPLRTGCQWDETYCVWICG